MPFESAHRQGSNIGDSVSFVTTLTATRSNLEHATCASRAHHIHTPPPHLINGIRLVCFGCRLARSTLVYLTGVLRRIACYGAANLPLRTKSRVLRL